MSLALASLRKLFLLPAHARVSGSNSASRVCRRCALTESNGDLMRVRPPLGCIFSLSLICAEASKESRVRPLFNGLRNNPMAHLANDTKISDTRKHKNEIIQKSAGIHIEHFELVGQMRFGWFFLIYEEPQSLFELFLLQKYSSKSTRESRTDGWESPFSLPSARPKLYYPAHGSGSYSKVKKDT